MLIKKSYYAMLLCLEFTSLCAQMDSDYIYMLTLLTTDHVMHYVCDYTSSEYTVSWWEHNKGLHRTFI